MKKKDVNSTQPDFLFSLSWEVCNKVGGIYTVLSTQAKTLKTQLGEGLVYIGPDFGGDNPSHDFIEDPELLADWRHAASEAGVPVRIGRWNVPGQPVAILVDGQALAEQRDRIYGEMWEKYRVDSLNAYGDYHDASLWAYGAGKAIEAIARLLPGKSRVVVQAHEWMSGMALLCVKSHCPGIATVFTTHATSIGRSITSNEKPLYDYFEGYYGDQMAQELHMEAKHSVEKCAAREADCLTTVSTMTDRECVQFLERACDVILPNGFEPDFVPKGEAYKAKRQAARQRMFQMAQALTGKAFSDDTLIIGTSGRNDFRCKGYDAFVGAMKQLQDQPLKRDILAILAVPCWKEGPRQDLAQAMAKGTEGGLDNATITHTLYNSDEDRIVATLRGYGLKTGAEQRVHVILVPSYLDGQDGILDLPYYDWLIGCDLNIYPSYYEPWGYTCLESVAFGIPCITTNLSGFGQWVSQLPQGEGGLSEGVGIIPRNDSNYDEAVGTIAAMVGDFAGMTATARRHAAAGARAIARQALWKDFIKHYNEAFAFALGKHNLD